MSSFEVVGFDTKPYEIELNPNAIEGLKQDFKVPFLRTNAWKRHLRPEWTGTGFNTARIRIFNSGYEGQYLNPKDKYCMGIAVLRKNGATHFLAEVHQPRLSSGPNRYAVRLTPRFGEVRVVYGYEGQLSLEQEVGGTAFLEMDEQNRLAELEYLSHRLTQVLPQISRYQKRFTEVSGRNDRAGTSFALPIFQKQPVRLFNEGGRDTENQNFQRLRELLDSI